MPVRPKAAAAAPAHTYFTHLKVLQADCKALRVRAPSREGIAAYAQPAEVHQHFGLFEGPVLALPCCASLQVMRFAQHGIAFGRWCSARQGSCSYAAACIAAAAVQQTCGQCQHATMHALQSLRSAQGARPCLQSSTAHLCGSKLRTQAELRAQVAQDEREGGACVALGQLAQRRPVHRYSQCSSSDQMKRVHYLRCH